MSGPGVRTLIWRATLAAEDLHAEAGLSLATAHALGLIEAIGPDPRALGAVVPVLHALATLADELDRPEGDALAAALDALADALGGR